MIPEWTADAGSVAAWVADVIVADMAEHGSWRCGAWVTGIPDSDVDPVVIRTVHWLAPHDVAESLSWCDENQDTDSDRDNTPINAEDGDRLPPMFGARMWARPAFRELVCIELRKRGFNAITVALGLDSHSIECWRKGE